VFLQSQCPDTGETKVFKAAHGDGYYFYRFLGESSFRYFLDGKTFSYNDKDDPGRTFIFIDDLAYESILVDRSDLAEYVKSTNPEDILRAQAKNEQDHYKKLDPSMVIMDYGASYRQNPDGSNDRLFYLWKKDNPHSKHPAPQYLCSTLVKDGVVMLSLFPAKASVSEDDILLQIQKYTSHFDVLSSDQCEKALSVSAAH
jgi:hypothetical protein